jgi:SAM-dependent methyltransferase
MDEGYVCPRCRSPLQTEPERYGCRACGSEYPLIGGIPDFRICADPYIDIEEDRAKALRLAEKAEHLPFAELVLLYYQITPEVPPDLAARYLAHHLAGERRGEAILQRMERYGINGQGALLDAGCGSAGFLAVARRRGFGPIFGIDIALRWLVIARRRLADLGLQDIHFAAGCADHLPFADGRFGLVVAENLLEHTRKRGAVLAELTRVRRRDGSFLARCVNRFALGPEPHVGVWGVGFVPRCWQDRFVRWRRGLPYEHVHLPSWPGLRRDLRRAGQTQLRVRCPELLPLDYEHRRPCERWLFALYGRLARALPAARPLLLLVGPYLDVVSEADSGTGSAR